MYNIGSIFVVLKCKSSRFAAFGSCLKNRGQSGVDRTHLYTLFHPDRFHSRSYSSTRRLLVSLRSFPDKPCVSSWTGVLETDTGSGQKKKIRMDVETRRRSSLNPELFPGKRHQNTQRDPCLCYSGWPAGCSDRVFEVLD